MHQHGNLPIPFPNLFNFIIKGATILGKSLPNPKLKNVKKAGSGIYHLLTWVGEIGAGQWVHDDFFKLLGEDGEIVSALEEDNSCNTRKSRDKVTLFFFGTPSFQIF